MPNHVSGCGSSAVQKMLRLGERSGGLWLLVAMQWMEAMAMELISGRLFNFTETAPYAVQ